MKRYFLFIFSLLSIGLCHSQVGINTKFPYSKSVFHIDAKGNNTSSTTISASDMADDIIIDSNGSIGVGTLAPTAKLHIDSSNSSMYPIRIADGSEGDKKYLTSNDLGFGSWVDKPEPNGVVYYSTTPRVFPAGVYTELPAEINTPKYPRITIPKEGNYIVTLRWWGNAVGAPSGVMTIGALDIQLCRVNGEVVDNTTYFVSIATGRFCFTVSLFGAKLIAGEQLYLRLKPMDGLNWQTGAGLNEGSLTNQIYYPSIMVYNI